MIMSEVIKKWLCKIVGDKIDLTSPENFARQAADGRLIAEVLRHYNIITYDQVDFIVPSSNVTVGYKNFKKYISVWLRSIGVDVTDEQICSITDAKGYAAVKLFYNLYLVLENKENFKTKKTLDSVKSRLETCLEKEGEITIQSSLYHPLNSHLSQGVMQWRKSKYRTVSSKRRAKSKEKNKIQEDLDEPKRFNNVSMGAFPSTSLPKNDPLSNRINREYIYEKLMSLKARAQEMQKIQEDPKTAVMVFKQLKKKRRCGIQKTELSDRKNLIK